jgi:8-oxo-dGTP pyrophosphatase MutT (NUDIX family)
MSSIKSVAGAVFSSDRSAVLLILRRDVPVWVLPGGGIDEGETAETAVVREILEETGFQVKIDAVVGTYWPMNRLAKPTRLFRLTPTGGEARLSEETNGVRFFPLSALPPLPPPYGEWIREAAAEGPPIERSLTSVNYRTLLFYFCRHPILVARFLLARLGLPMNTARSCFPDQGHADAPSSEDR